VSPNALRNDVLQADDGYAVPEQFGTHAIVQFCDGGFY
jgi:hypothetical protein